MGKRKHPPTTPPTPPTPPPPPPASNRSFADASWWNTPIPSTVKVDPRSDAMTVAQAKSCGPPTVGAPTGAWAIPWSEIVSGGLQVTIKDSKGNSTKVYVDPHVGEMGGDDAAIVFRDWRTGVEVSTFETVIPRKADGTVDASKPITCKAYGKFGLNTNGIDKAATGGDPANSGHRGVPPSSMALTPWEADGRPIQSRKKVSLGPPADHPGPNWPMTGIESPRGGAIPEGANIRRKAPGSNPVQVAAHVYGFIIGDTAGAGKSTLKTVQGGHYDKAVIDALDGDTWADWEVMTLGWR